MINIDELPLVDIFDEHSLTKEQVKTIIQVIRDSWKTATVAEKHEYQHVFFNFPHQRHLSPFHIQILTSIRESLILTEQQMEAASRRILYWINQTLFARAPVDQALFCHSVLSHQPDVQPVRFLECGMDRGASSVIFSFLNGSTRLSLAQTNRAQHSAVRSQLHKKVQDAIFNGALLFGVPDVWMPVRCRDHDQTTSLSQLVKTTRECLKADKMLVFSSKHDAYLYAYSRRLPAGSRHHPIRVLPIVTLVPLGDERPHFRVLDRENSIAPLTCAYVNPGDCVGLKVDLYSGEANWLGDRQRTQTCRSALLKTTFDPPVEMIPRSEVPNMTPLMRQLGHRLFMRSIGHRIASTHDFICWLEEFYCDQYLIQKKNGIEKRAELKAAIADIKQAQRNGLDLGTTVDGCLQLIPVDATLEDLLRNERLFEAVPDGHSPEYLVARSERVWGWKTVRDTFMVPKLSPHQRDQAHKAFMQTLGDGPLTLLDFKKWFKLFYCRYLLAQKNGMEKVRWLQECYQALERDVDTSRFTIEDYVDAILPGQPYSLGSIIGGRRRGSSDKPSWGWQTIKSSFILPERAQIAESQVKSKGKA